MRLEVKFHQKYTPTTSGCWLWKGHLNNNGYGRFYTEPGSCYAHRWAYTRWVGPIPEGFQIDHLCRVRHCVNPSHLEAVTPPGKHPTRHCWRSSKSAHSLSTRALLRQSEHLRKPHYRQTRL